MAIPTKTNPTQTVTLENELSNPPPLPPMLLARFPEMRDWEKRNNEWWSTVKKVLIQDRTTMLAEVNRLAQNQSSST